MILEEKQLRTLRPKEGFLLTQSADVPNKDRVFAQVVSLSVNDSPDNWKEISAENAEAFNARMLEEQNARKAREDRENRRKELEAELAKLDNAE